MSGWISVRRWDDFQHMDVRRGSTAPPWIKNYTRLMDSDEYLELTAPQRGVLHGIWLLYAKSRCEVRGSTASLSRRLGVRVTNEQLKALVQAGFLDIVASKSQAEGWQVAGTTRARGEVEGEVERARDLHQEGLSSSNGSEEALQSPAAAHEAAQPANRHVCEASTSEGDLCGASFDTLRALAIHRHEAHQLGLEAMPTDVEELVERWSGETA